MSGTITLHDALAAAYAAWRVNGCYRNKEKVEYAWIGDTRIRKTWANRELATLALRRWHSREAPSIEITEEDHVNADTADRRLKHLTVKAITNGLNSFEGKVYQILGKEEIDVRSELGLICYVPVMVQNEMDRKKTNDFIKSFAEAPTLPVGQGVQGNVNIHSRRFIKHMNCWLYLGELNGSLVTFYRDLEITKDTVHISARVKEVVPCYENRKVMTSVINYVKL